MSLGRGLFMIHSFSFKCESHWLVWWSSTRWHKFLFFKCMWTLQQRKQTSLWPIMLCCNGRRRRRRWKKTYGAGFWCMKRGICLSRDSWDEGGDPCWPATCRDFSLSSGTPEDLQHVLWKARLCFAERTCLWKSVELMRPCWVMCHLQHCHWVELPEETPICFIALLKTTRRVLISPQRRNNVCRPDEPDTLSVQVGPKNAHSISS